VPQQCMTATGSPMRTIPFGCPVIGPEEKRAVLEVLEGPVLTHGPRVKEFEGAFARFAGADRAIATSSCTASLHLAYLFLELKPGDEVIVPAQTHIATAHAVELCGGCCVFVDSEKTTGNIDIDQIPQAITGRTKAISIVHYLGMPVDMDRVMEIARKHGLFVVEDCALALGTYWKGVHAGLRGDIGCFSFYPVKHITTAEGGMILTRHADVADKVAKYRAFGIDRNVVSERAIPGMYDVEGLGLNYRLNEIGAALGIEQMKRLPGILATRRENYRALSRGLSEIDEVTLLQPEGGNARSSHYCLSMLLRPPLQGRRFEIMQHLRNAGVGTSVYYPRPVPLMSYYRNKYQCRDGSYPVAAWLSDSSIALTVGPHVTPDDVRYMVESVKCAIREVR
jgi:perosamine synthetase